MPLKMMNSSPNDPEIVETFYDSGELHTQYWYQNDQLHRVDGPAWVIYFDSPGKEICNEYWYLYGKRHREDGPARVTYDEFGKIRFEDFYLNDYLHRTDGPAEIWYNPSEKFQYIAWYLHHERIHPENWLKDNGYKWPLSKEQQTEFLLVFG